MPKIFKKNKLVLLLTNIFIIYIWILISSFLKDVVIYENAPFYIYKLLDIFKYLPPIWITYYFWIVRKGLK